jgi:hypothetical protein
MSTGRSNRCDKSYLIPPKSNNVTLSEKSTRISILLAGLSSPLANEPKIPIRFGLYLIMYSIILLNDLPVIEQVAKMPLSWYYLQLCKERLPLLTAHSAPAGALRNAVSPEVIGAATTPSNAKTPPNLPRSELEISFTINAALPLFSVITSLSSRIPPKKLILIAAHINAFACTVPQN